MTAPAKSPLATKGAHDDDPFVAASHYLTKLTPNQLMVDYQVQRPADSVRIADISSKFEPKALSVIHVSHRKDGSRHIVDGQTRVGACRIAGYGDTAVDVVIWKDLSLAGEAKLFLLLNNTRQVQALDKFRIKIVEGDRAAVVLNDLLERNGWTIRKSLVPGSFYAVTALQNAYLARDGGDLATCETLLRICTTAWGHDCNGVRAEIVKGLGALIPVYPSLDENKLTSELGKIQGGPLGLIGRARQLKEIRSCRIADAMAEVMVNLHNRGRKIRLPEWRER